MSNKRFSNVTFKIRSSVELFILSTALKESLNNKNATSRRLSVEASKLFTSRLIEDDYEGTNEIISSTVTQIQDRYITLNLEFT